MRGLGEILSSISTCLKFVRMLMGGMQEDNSGLLVEKSFLRGNTERTVPISYESIFLSRLNHLQPTLNRKWLMIYIEFFNINWQ